MRTRVVLLALLLAASSLRAQDLLLLLDGLDPLMLDAYDVDGRALSPTLAQFRDASDGGLARAGILDPEGGADTFGRNALDVLRGGASLERDRVDPQEAMRRLREGFDGPMLVHLPDDPKRPLDELLLLRCDPTPWAGASSAHSHASQRERRLQRGRAFWELRANGRAPRAGTRHEDGDWLARVRAAELEAQIAPLLEFLLDGDGATSVLLAAMHGARDFAGDLSPRARRVPAFRLRMPVAVREPDAHWTIALPLRPREARFAREDGDDCLRVEDGRLLLFDRRLDPDERFDRARMQPALVREETQAARRELFGGDEATLILEIESTRARELLVGPLPPERVLVTKGSQSGTRGSMLRIDVAAGGQAHVELRLRYEDAGLRVLGDLRGLSLRVGASPWTAAGQLDLDLASGTLLAAIQDASGAPQGPEDRMRLWIEAAPQRPDEAP